MTPKAKKLSNYTLRASALRQMFDIDPVQPIVGLKDENAIIVEWVVHDIAHALTLGFRTLVTNLSASVSMMMDRLTIQTQDSLEIDTAWLTYKALQYMHLATDPDRARIARACAHNLSDESKTGRKHYVLDQFDIRDEQNHRNSALADHLTIFKDLFRKPLVDVKRLCLPDDGAAVQGR
jgi:hypothetical protein